jgi:NAD(P)-dependent dehydrogenase (short-subunit alcohol dehydrogenase family)
VSQQPVVLVLGAGIGGQGVAGALAGTAEIVVVDRDLALAEAAVQMVRDAGGSADAHVVNLTDLAEVQQFRDEVVDRYGQVDAVVHLVGGWAGSKTVDEEALEQFNALLPGIVTTVQTTSVAFRKALASGPKGRYVMVTSTAVARPRRGSAAYAAAKSAAQAWVMSLADAFAGTDARAAVVAVSWLASPQMVADEPDRDFSGATLTTGLGAVIAEMIGDPNLPQGAYIDLTAVGA